MITPAGPKVPDTRRPKSGGHRSVFNGFSGSEAGPERGAKGSPCAEPLELSALLRAPRQRGPRAWAHLWRACSPNDELERPSDAWCPDVRASSSARCVTGPRHPASSSSSSSPSREYGVSAPSMSISSSSASWSSCASSSMASSVSYSMIFCSLSGASSDQCSAPGRKTSSQPGGSRE